MKTIRVLSLVLMIGVTIFLSSANSLAASSSVLNKCWDNQIIGMDTIYHNVHPSAAVGDSLFANDNSFPPNFAVDRADICNVQNPTTGPSGVWGICFYHTTNPSAQGCGWASDQLDSTSGVFKYVLQANRVNWQNWESFTIGCDPVGHGVYVRRYGGGNFWYVNWSEPAGLGSLITVTGTAANLSNPTTTSFMIRSNTGSYALMNALGCRV